MKWNLALRASAVVSCAALVSVIGMSAASAHVTVSSPGAVSGGTDTIISFRVPDESDTASTVGLKVQLPTDTPIADVLVQPLTGWTAKVIQSKLATPITTDDGTITEAVSEIDWSLSTPSAAVKPGQFQQFVVIAGKLPDTSSLTFKAIQTYSDGKVVSWVQQSTAGTEADFPAPVLTLAAASAAGGTAPATPSATAAKGASTGSVRIALGIGVLGVLVGACGVALAVRRRST